MLDALIIWLCYEYLRGCVVRANWVQGYYLLSKMNHKELLGITMFVFAGPVNSLIWRLTK